MNDTIPNEWTFASTGTATMTEWSSGQTFCPYSTDYCWDGNCPSGTASWSLTRDPQSTIGYRNVILTWFMSMEGKQGEDDCYIEYMTDKTAWRLIHQTESDTSGRTGVFETWSGTSADNNDDVRIRLRSTTNGGDISCYYNELTLAGDPIPTSAPTTISPTKDPTLEPTHIPTANPSYIPTYIPTTIHPTYQPTNAPTQYPSSNPTSTPTLIPSTNPTLTPTLNPTTIPTNNPTRAPSVNPSTLSPTDMPTHAPTDIPTNEPTDIPTPTPSAAPTDVPTYSPTSSPTRSPTYGVCNWKFETDLIFIVDNQCRLDNEEIIVQQELISNLIQLTKKSATLARIGYIECRDVINVDDLIWIGLNNSLINGPYEQTKREQQIFFDTIKNRNKYSTNGNYVPRAQCIGRALIEFDNNDPNHYHDNKIVLITNCQAQSPTIVCDYHNELKFEHGHVNVYSFNLGIKTDPLNRNITDKTNECLVNEDLNRIISFDYINKETIYDARNLAKIYNIVFNKICVRLTSNPTTTPTASPTVTPTYLPSLSPTYNPTYNPSVHPMTTPITTSHVHVTVSPYSVNETNWTIYLIVGSAAVIVIISIVVVSLMCWKQNKLNNNNVVNNAEHGYKLTNVNVENPNKNIPLEHKKLIDNNLQPESIELEQMKDANNEFSDDDENDDMYVNSQPTNTPTNQYEPKADVQKWLQFVVKLPQYYEIFVNNGFTSFELICEINKIQYLNYIGIHNKAHQIKFMNHIQRLQNERNVDEIGEQLTV